MEAALSLCQLSVTRIEAGMVGEANRPANRQNTECIAIWQRSGPLCCVDDYAWKDSGNRRGVLIQLPGPGKCLAIGAKTEMRMKILPPYNQTGQPNNSGTFEEGANTIKYVRRTRQRQSGPAGSLPAHLYEETAGRLWQPLQ